MSDGISTVAILPSRCKVSPRLRRICRLRRRSDLAIWLKTTSESAGELNPNRCRLWRACHFAWTCAETGPSNKNFFQQIHNPIPREIRVFTLEYPVLAHGGADELELTPSACQISS